MTNDKNKLINTNYAILLSQQVYNRPLSSEKEYQDPVPLFSQISNLDRSVEPRLIINAHLLNIQHYQYYDNYQSIYKELRRLYLYSSKLKLTNDEYYQLAKTFSAYFDFEKSYHFLSKIAKSRDPKPEHLLYDG